jgi:hypothetical protein
MTSDILRDLELSEPVDQIIARIQRHETAFNKLDELFATILRTQTAESASILLTEITAAVGRRGASIAPTHATTTISMSTELLPPATNPPSTTPSPGATSRVPSHTAQRLTQSRGEQRLGDVPPYEWTCVSDSSNKRPPVIQFYWETGTSLPSYIADTGTTCIELHPEFNDILFKPSFSITAQQPQGTAFDLLKDAFSALASLPIAGTPAIPPTDTKKADAKAGSAPATKDAQHGKPQCPPTIPGRIKTAVQFGAAFEDALKLLLPDKDDNGKFKYVERQITIGLRPNVAKTYGRFEDAVVEIIKDLNNDDADVCTDDTLSQAEAIVVDLFGPAKKAYGTMLSHAEEEDSMVRFAIPLESTFNYDATTKPTYSGGDTNADVKAVHLAAGHSLLTASAGVLITQLPARSYLSVTAPTTNNNSTTENVLSVDYGRGPRPAFAVLLNFHPPVSWLDKPQFGFALSAGPVFDISNGKADTSRFGFFAGPSIRFGEHVYLTPGIHVGEFADFPQGFTAPGQVIPANTGVPGGVKRYTARFALGLTIKVRSILEPTPKPSGSGGTK